MQNDVEAIVRGLSKAQKEQILRGAIGGDVSMRTVKALLSKNLMYLRIDSPNGRCGFVECTPLGLSVQSALRAAKETSNSSERVDK